MTLNNQCIFCDIVSKKHPADILRENESVVIIKDIRPSAPVHYLAISKYHIDSIANITDADKPLLAEIVTAAKKAAEELGLTGYKLVFNVGRDGGQIIDHIHLHILGGWMPNEPKKVNV